MKTEIVTYPLNGTTGTQLNATAVYPTKISGEAVSLVDFSTYTEFRNVATAHTTNANGHYFGHRYWNTSDNGGAGGWRFLDGTSGDGGKTVIDNALASPDFPFDSGWIPLDGDATTQGDGYVQAAHGDGDGTNKPFLEKVTLQLR